MAMWWTAASLVVLGVAAVVLFNRLVAARNLVRAAWSDIDVQLTRRHDLVPQLVAAVQGFAGHERGALKEVIALRVRAQALASPAARAVVETELARRVETLLALQERYPDLKASSNFLQLQRDLVAIEDHLQHARRFYNGAVRDLNTRIESFPSVVVARLARFRPAEFFRQGIDQEAPA